MEDINQGLDNASVMLQARDTAGMNREYDRNLLKARRILESREDEREQTYQPAKIVA